MKIIPSFIDGAFGKILITLFTPDPSKKYPSLLIVPPFVEEMNKSRRMLSLMAKKACAEGFQVLLLDYFGTGDSQGDFADASWECWLTDLEQCVDLLVTDSFPALNILALRGGSLLAAELMRSNNLLVDKLILWQPVNSGDIWLTQFLRLRLAASMMNAGGEKETVKELKERLISGESIEVAGYEMSSALAVGIMSVKLENSVPKNAKEVIWLELVTSEGKSLLPVSKKVIDKWNEKTLVIPNVVTGKAFWGATEIIEVPELLDKTITCLQK